MNIGHVLKIPSVTSILLADMRNPKGASDLTSVPKDLIFNWVQIHEKFIHKLKPYFSIKLKYSQHLTSVKSYNLLQEVQLFKYLTNKQSKIISI